MLHKFRPGRGKFDQHPGYSSLVKIEVGSSPRRTTRSKTVRGIGRFLPQKVFVVEAQWFCSDSWSRLDLRNLANQLPFVSFAAKGEKRTTNENIRIPRDELERIGFGDDRESNRTGTER